MARSGFLRKESGTWIEILRTVSRMLLLLVCPMFMLCIFTFDVLEDHLEDTYMGPMFVAAAGSTVAGMYFHSHSYWLVNLTPLHTYKI